MDNHGAHEDGGQYMLLALKNSVGLPREGKKATQEWSARSQLEML